MKIQVCNLGAIKQAEIDLKPLTVFVGGNGTGKTWTAYTLASIFGQHGFERYLKAYNENKTETKYEILENAIKTFLQSGSTQVNLLQFTEDYAEKYINNVSSLAYDGISEFLNTNRANFNDLQVKFNLSESKNNIIDNVKNYSLDREIYFGSQLSVKILKQEKEEDIYFFLVYEGGNSKKIPKILDTSLRNLFFETIFNLLHKCFYSYIYIFPTERTTYIGLPFSVSTKEVQLNIEKLIQDIENENALTEGFESHHSRSEQKSSINEEKVIPKLLNILKLLDFEDISKQKISNNKKQRLAGSAAIKSLIEIIAMASLKEDAERRQEAEENPKIQDYINLAQLLESDILYGNVTIDSSKPQNEIVFQPSRNTTLEMQVSSSMVKELAPLFLCLRYLAEPNELLIIDEPEMNLHPSAQVEIIEFLSMLVNAGLHVLITTHSPYIVEHLSNLMKAAKYEDKESIKNKFYLENSQAFIPQEKVSVYLFEDGTAKNILEADCRIEWGTFGDVSEDISHIFW